MALFGTSINPELCILFAFVDFVVLLIAGCILARHDLHFGRLALASSIAAIGNFAIDFYTGIQLRLFVFPIMLAIDLCLLRWLAKIQTFRALITVGIVFLVKSGYFIAYGALLGAIG